MSLHYYARRPPKSRPPRVLRGTADRPLVISDTETQDHRKCPACGVWVLRANRHHGCPAFYAAAEAGAPEPAESEVS